MKIKSLVIASAFAGVLFSSASAITTTPAATFEAPAPIKTAEPVLVPSSHHGSMVNVTMTIDQAGKPSNIRVANVSDQAAYKRFVDSVKKWEFSPARKNGQPVSTRVELPVEVKGL
jgi:protein TonB